jgi:hypothetical protein
MHFASTNAIAYPRKRRVAVAGAAGSRHLRICFAGARRRPAAGPFGEARALLADPDHQREGRAGGVEGRLRRIVRGFIADAAGGAGGRVCGRGSAPAFEQRQSDRGGRLAPIVGTVSMDLTTIDITHSPGMKPGDEVTLLGREGDVALDAQQIARTAGTISYNVLCGISARVKRFYVE